MKQIPKEKLDLIIKIIILALMTAFLTISVITIFHGKTKKSSNNIAKTRGETSLVTVSVKEMQAENIQSIIKLTGNISSMYEIAIYPDVAGKVTKIEKHLGDYVQKGNVIAFIDPSRPGSVYSANPVISEISGSIIDLPIDLGDTVTTSSVIATVGNLRQLRVKVFVSEKYSDYLKVGMKAYVNLTSIPNEKFASHTVKINPVVNKSNRTIEVELNFDEYDARLKPGMFASVELVIQEKDDVFVVPKSAIKNYNGKSTVLVAMAEQEKTATGEQNAFQKETVSAPGENEGALEKKSHSEKGTTQQEKNAIIACRKEITTGLENDLESEVTSGLEKGMRVIIAGSAIEGSKLRIVGDAG